MLRPLLAVAAALFVLPGAGSAQTAANPGADGRLRVTPYFTWLPEIARHESRFLVLGNEAEDYEARFDLATGYGGGVNVEIIFADPAFFYVDGAFVRREDSREFSALEGGTRREVGSDWVMTRAGFGIRVRDPDDALQLRRVGGSLFVGAALIHEIPRTDPFRTHADNMNLFGLNFGIQGDVPLFGSSFSLSAALEDNLVWWPDDELGTRNDSVYASIGLPTQTTVSTGPTHIWIVRFGIAYRR